MTALYFIFETMSPLINQAQGKRDTGGGEGEESCCSRRAHLPARWQRFHNRQKKGEGGVSPNLGTNHTVDAD